MEFLDYGSAHEVLAELRKTWPKGELIQNESATSYVIDALFSEKADWGHGPLSLNVVGTNFQVAVWRNPTRAAGQLLSDCQGVGLSQGIKGRGQRDWRQSRCVADPVPSSHPAERRHGRVPLGSAKEADGANVGVFA